MRTTTLLAALLFSVYSASSSAKQIYQCVDHAGNTVLSDGGGCRAAKQKITPSHAQKQSNTHKQTGDQEQRSAAETKPAAKQTVITIARCDVTGCWDAQQVRYTKSGQVYLASNGKTCKRQGAQMFCN